MIKNAKITMTTIPMICKKDKPKNAANERAPTLKRAYPAKMTARKSQTYEFDPNDISISLLYFTEYVKKENWYGLLHILSKAAF